MGEETNVVYGYCGIDGVFHTIPQKGTTIDGFEVSTLEALKLFKRTVYGPKS